MTSAFHNEFAVSILADLFTGWTLRQLIHGGSDFSGGQLA
jgi:hypothetical protein